MNAIDIKNMVLAAIAAVGAAIANALGGWDTAIICLFAFMVTDYITGIVVAAVFHNSVKTEKGGMSSHAAVKGFIKKIFILVIVAMACLLDKVMKVDFMRTAVILFFIANEGLSILENGGLMGIPYPKFLRNALEVMREQADGGRAVTETELRKDDTDNK